MAATTTTTGAQASPDDGAEVQQPAAASQPSSNLYQQDLSKLVSVPRKLSTTRRPAADAITPQIGSSRLFPTSVALPELFVLRPR